jgi:hypothetical protein
MSEPLTSLVKKIDQRVNEAAGVRQSGPELGTYVIFVNNADGLECDLDEMARNESLKRVSLGIGAVPADYNIAKEADLTVVIYEVGRRGNSVSANFALRMEECDEKQVEAIIAALSKVLPK